jgi:hypothetical protein
LFFKLFKSFGFESDSILQKIMVNLGLVWCSFSFQIVWIAKTRMGESTRLTNQKIQARHIVVHHTHGSHPTHPANLKKKNIDPYWYAFIDLLHISFSWTHFLSLSLCQFST